MKMKKSALYTGVAAIVLVAGATTLAMLADESAEPSAAVASTAEAGTDITVYKSPNCSCCQSWAEHLAANGFDTTLLKPTTLVRSNKSMGCPVKWRPATPR